MLLGVPTPAGDFRGVMLGIEFPTLAGEVRGVVLWIVIVHSDVRNVLSDFDVGVEHVVRPTPVDTRSTPVDTRRDRVRIETGQTEIRHWRAYSFVFPHLARTVVMCHTIEQIHHYIPVRSLCTPLENSTDVTPSIWKPLQGQGTKSRLIFWVLEDEEIMGIPRDGLGIFSGWKQVLTYVQHRNVPMIRFSGEQIQDPFVVPSFVHEIV